MTSDDLDFIERPIRELLARLEEKRAEGTDAEGVARLARELEAKRREVYAHLTPWQTTLIARHPKRPYTLDLVSAIMTDWMEIAGDRSFGDDRAIVAGFARLGEREVMVIGHQKGRDTSEKLLRNFGMPRPEGYRKALRAMKLAERFGRPVVTFIDTPGAYPGIDAEERGQAEAIAVNLREMSRLSVPIVAIVTGEGGSGGALALGVADHVLMLEHAIYSVISPEGCAAILWKDGGRARDAAEALRLTAPDLKRLGIVDEIVPEPAGGAHWDVPATLAELEPRLASALDRLSAMDPLERSRGRYAKFRAMGAVA